MKRLILSLFLAIIFFSGCKTKEVIRYVEIPKETIRIDSVTIERTDSFIQFSKKDTIYEQRFKTIYKDRIRIERDSIAVPFEVKVEVPVEVIKEVNKFGFLDWIGAFSILILVLWTLKKRILG